jgi:hypothetical protein
MRHESSPGGASASRIPFVTRNAFYSKHRRFFSGIGPRDNYLAENENLHYAPLADSEF